jgi:hypothetical protein
MLTAYLLVQYLMQRLIRADVAHVRGLESLGREALQVDAGFLELMNQVSGSATRWTPRLARLTELLPADAWISGLQAGSLGMPLSDPRRSRMVVHVSARILNEDDKVTVPMRFVQKHCKVIHCSPRPRTSAAATRTLEGNVQCCNST